MGSIEILRYSLRTDLSERVLLLHGLSGCPSPHGSYVLCEVNLSADEDPNGNFGSEQDVQFVIEAIPNTDTGDDLTGLGENVRLGDVRQENQNGLHQSYEYSETECSQDEGGLLTGDIKQELEMEMRGTAEPIFNSLSPVSFSYSTFLQEGAVKAATEQSTCSFLAELAVLAPGISIFPASYDNLVNIVRESRGRIVNGNKEQKMLKPEDIDPSSSEQDEEKKVFKSKDNLVNGNDEQWVGSKRHPNLAPILGILQGECYLYVIYPAMACTFQSLLYFSPGALGDDQHIRFLIFQILSAIAYSHKQGLIHGDLRPSNILLTDNLWCLVTGFLPSPRRRENINSRSSQSALINRDVGLSRTSIFHPEPSMRGFLSDWRDTMKGWWAGEVSNYDYLLLLNKVAGRRWGDPCFHTVMPWVIDFSVKPDQTSGPGWRDLTKSKWRLAKGDEQLDFTYASAEMPHHVSDECLSELAVCIYKARRLPLLVLRQIVRSVYEPNEYPANMQRLYQWTPDECIPEFYSDAHIFESVHPGMSNLAVPKWAKGAKEFTSLHRAALECDRVSGQLHHWIDLTFGYKLSGVAAVDAKNVTLATVGPTVPRSSGRRQLFSKPHPRRQHSKTADVLEKEQESTLQNTGMPMPFDTLKETRELGPTDTISTLFLPSTKMGLLSEAQDYDTVQSRHFNALESLEEITYFSESGRHLSPCYKVPLDVLEDGDTSEGQIQERNRESVKVLKVSPQTLAQTLTGISSPYNLNAFIALLDDSCQYQKLVESLQEEGDDGGHLFKSVCSIQIKTEHRKNMSVGESEDILAIGCMIAELYLKRPLFDPTTATAYKVQGTEPGLLECLPLYVQFLVKSTLQKELSRRPTASELLDSPFFSSTIRAVYFFLAPLQLLSNSHDRLQYVAKMAKEGAFVSMGHSAAEMCAPSVLSLIVPPYQDIDVYAVIILITELLQALRQNTSKRLLVPVIQKLLQVHLILTHNLFRNAMLAEGALF